MRTKSLTLPYKELNMALKILNSRSGRRLMNKEKPLFISQIYSKGKENLEQRGVSSGQQYQRSGSCKLKISGFCGYMKQTVKKQM